MKNKVKKIACFKDESGLVIVEAAIVFPVMFFVLLFIIFIGNMYFEQARIDSIVTSYAVKGAEYISDPNLYSLDNGGTLPLDVRNMDIEPYRYIRGSKNNGVIHNIETTLSDKVKQEISNGSLMFFSNQRVNVINSDNSKIAYYNGKVLCSTFIVQVNYEIKFPIRFLMENEPTIMKLSSRAEVAVNDSPEFIRNVDMVVDLLDGSTLSDNIKGIFDKINGFINKFGN